MKCPYCNHPDTRVIDSRPAEDNNSIRRRRCCDVCGKRFTTYEKLETISLVVIKRDMSRQQFDRNKVLSGIIHACEKRPIPLNRMEEIVDDIEADLYQSMSKEIESNAIGEKVFSRKDCGTQHLATGVENINDHCQSLGDDDKGLQFPKAINVIKQEITKRDDDQRIPKHIRDDKVFAKGDNIIQRRVNHVTFFYGDQIFREKIENKIYHPAKKQFEM